MNDTPSTKYEQSVGQGKVNAILMKSGYRFHHKITTDSLYSTREFRRRGQRGQLHTEESKERRRSTKGCCQTRSH